jgi:hypothetical protein
MTGRKNEWMAESEKYLMEQCSCKVLTHGDGVSRGLIPQKFIQHERQSEDMRLICTTSETVYSLKRLIFKENDISAYIGLLRTKVKKGYWSQFVCVMHVRQPRSFIIVLSKDMADNIMQRFVWKMFHPMQYRVLMAVKRHLLFEDKQALEDIEF